MQAEAKIVKDAEYWTNAYLDTWARSMRGSDSPDGLPSDSCCGIMQCFATLDANSEHAYEKLDAWIAEVTGAVLWELPSIQRNVIWHAYDLIALVGVRDYQGTLAAGKLNVQAGLRRRGVWLGE